MFNPPGCATVLTTIGDSFDYLLGCFDVFFEKRFLNSLSAENQNNSWDLWTIMVGLVNSLLLTCPMSNFRGL